MNSQDDVHDDAANEENAPMYMRQSLIQSCAVDDVLMTETLLAVLVALGSYATKRNQQWLLAGQGSIARRMGKSRQAIGQACRDLEELGYVQIEPRFREDGGKTSNWVRLILDFQLPEERKRCMYPRKKAGQGGRPRGSTAKSTSTPPETPVVSYPSETPVVSGDETPVVSGDETPVVSGDETPVVSSLIRSLNSEIEGGKGIRRAGARGSSSINQDERTEPEPDILPPPSPPPSLSAIWQKAARSLHRGLSERGALSASEWDNWIAPIRLCDYHENAGWHQFTLAAPGSYAAEMLETRYLDALIYALAKAAKLRPDLVLLRIVVEPKKAVI